MASRIGPLLISAREQRGLTLEDVAHETRIPKQRLHWLEQDNYAAFGSMTYAASFLKIYSRYLGIDAQDLLFILRTSSQRSPRDFRYLAENHRHWSRAGRQTLPPRDPTPVRAPTQSPLAASIALFILILTGTAFWGHHVLEQNSQAHAASVATAPAVLPEPSAEIASSLRLERGRHIMKKGVLNAAGLTNPAAAFDAGISSRMD